MNIHPNFAKNISTQSYAPSPAIEGVERITQQLHQDDGGNFAEVFRCNETVVENLQTPFEVRQVSMSLLVPGSIKAYHLHKEQDDLWFVPPSHRLLVNLHDLREDSASFDVHQRFVLGGGSATVLRIPAGVAHGVANPYEQEMLLFYATNRQFSVETPDEHRLPWDLFGSDVWEVTKG